MPERIWPSRWIAATAGPLEKLLQFFPADHVLVLQYERLVEDPKVELAATYGFLGLEDDYRPGGDLRPGPTAPLPPLDERTEQRLIELYAADVADLAGLVPTLDLAGWPRFAAR